MRFPVAIAIAMLASISVIGTLMVLQGTLMADCFAAHPTEKGGDRVGFMIGEERNADLVSLEEARELANFTFNIPNRLPCDTSLDTVYISHSRESVLIGYINPEIPHSHRSNSFLSSVLIEIHPSSGDPVPGLLKPDSVIVKVIDEDGEEIFEVITESRGRLVKLCGLDAYAEDAAYDAGRLRWWNKGIAYTISARLPMNELVMIGNSMC